MKFVNKSLDRPSLLLKKQRQRRFMALARLHAWSPHQVVNAARMIPKEMVQEFQVVQWLR